MNKKIIRLTESDLHNVIQESVNKILSELDWKTYMNAARGRKAQADRFRDRLGSDIRTVMDDSSDELEDYAADVFNRQHGRDGADHNYEGDSPEYGGRRHYFKDRDFRYHGDADFRLRNTPSRSWVGDDGEEVSVRQYRHGMGVPYRNGGYVYDDTADVFSDERAPVERRHTMRINAAGSKYDPNLSTVGNEVSLSQDPDYRSRQDAMEKDMSDYYSGKSKYVKGKGWK